ncbi:unnamed protein product [Rhizoctonia solani]|uniref:Uncharacterized protein n=1 Tax=Rhizoctonia solani TaxID=456999 RepID=A0A8H3E305_9AGAM|nr:unnamed protein product [Rhizoctonia solani]
MKRHVSTTIHKLTLNKARVQSVSTDMPPPLPPPCAPWARIQPTYSKLHLSSCTCTLNVPHTDTDTNTGSGSGSGSGSDFEIGLSAHACAWKHTRGLCGEQVTHTLSAADDICLKQDPNLDASTIQNEDINGILASILNEDVLRDFNETPVWEPGPNDIAPSAPLVDSNTCPWPDKTHYHTHILFRSPEHWFSRSQQCAILHWAKFS